MRPALSVIVFTVLSGAGLGLAFWWAVHGMFCHSCAVGTNGRFFGVSLTWIAALVTIGLISSTQHLANPKNAWRAFSRFKTSWLSREGVLAVLFYPLLALFAAGVWFSAAPVVRGALGALVALCALAVLYCTGMIYACLKTVPQWHTWCTPVKYLLYGLTSGLLVFVAIASQTLERDLSSLLRFAVVLLLLAWGFCTHDATVTPKEPSLNSALGFQEGRVRLLDVGHSHGTFLTNEFGFPLAREKAVRVRAAVHIFGFAVPLIVLVLELSTQPPGILGIAPLSCVLGLLCERWLFFAQARHVVMRYHGQ